MESVPRPSLETDVAFSPDNDQANSLGHLVHPTESYNNTEVELKLSPSHAKALGCIACLTNRGKDPATETAKTLTECSGKSKTNSIRNLQYLSDQELITSRDRTTMPTSGRKTASRKEYLLTDKGSGLLPDDWSRCRKVEEINPIERLTERQRNLVRCITCLTAQGAELRNESIAYCTNSRPANVSYEMQKLVADGLLTTHKSAREPAETGRRRIVYQPTPGTNKLLPLPPPKDSCNFAQQEQQRELAKLSPEQQRLLGCIACINARTTNEFGAEKTVTEQCTKLDITVSTRAGHALTTLGLVEQNTGFTTNGTNNRMRVFYKLNAEGQKLANAIEAEIECREPEIIDATHISTAIGRCLECLWSQQVASNIEPAAALNMISRCTGIDSVVVARNLKPLMHADRVQRIIAPSDALNGTRQKTVAFAPLGDLVQLRVGEACNLTLYPEIPPEYLQPVELAKSIRYERSSDDDRETINDFLESKKHHPNLTKEQEFALGDIIQNSPDEAARRQAIATFVEHNVRHALWYTVHKAAFERIFLSFEDCVQEALRGIESAAKRYDPTFEVRFATYAQFWLKQTIRRAAGTRAAIPAHKFDKFPIAHYKAEEFTALHGRAPTVLELALACKLTPRHMLGVIEARNSLAKGAISLDQPITNEGGNKSRMFGGDRTMHDMIGFEQADFGSIEIFEAVQKIVPYLADHEKAVLGNILGYHALSREQIGETFGLSAMTIHNSRQRVESLLRHPYFSVAVNSKSREWQLDAACATSSNSAVVERVHGAREVPPEVAKMCGFCPVRKECFVETLKGDKPVTAGIWAGFNTSQLREYHKRSRS